ncbi:beta-galactosidase [Cohnella soli]|uniref:Beta-galactosidase n=1 Tax=Cohnella soli TaxID=425005 RepID=A0ABW0HW22_9BACL
MRTRLKRMLGIALATACLGQSAACTTDKPLEEPQYSADKKLTIGAWVAPPPDFINEQTYKDVADSGINLIYALYEDADLNALKALQLAEKNGIQYLVRSRAASSVPEDELDLLDGMFDDYKNSPAFGGVLVSDEPGALKFKKLGALHEKFKQLLPGKHFYVNLFPTYSSLDQRDGRTYKEYVDEYIQTVKPDFVSFDHYPLMQGVDGPYTKEDHLLNLDIVSNASKKAGLPFWAFIQSIGFSTAGTQNRDPDEKDIRWQAYNALAFGAKGIQYFTYWTPSSDGAARFSKAMVDADGTKTPLYDAVKNVNEEILSFDQIYLNYDNVGVMTFPVDNAPANLYTENRLAEFETIKEVASEQPVVIGCFQDKNGNQALVLVNYTDPAANQTNKVSIKLDGIKGVSQYDKDGHTISKTSGGKYEVTLQPGEGKFIMLLK